MIFRSFFFVNALFTGYPQFRVVIQLDHLSDNLVRTSVEVAVVIVDACVVTALVENPLFFAGSKLPLELTVVFADHALERVVVAVAEVVGSLRNSLGSLDIVGDQSQSVWTETFKDFSVETSVLLS